MAKELRKIGKNGKMRAIRSDNKYDEKYAKQLASGIRYTKGLSIVELCRKWRISRTTYENWINTYEDFKHAHELGKMDYASYWHENFKGIALGEIKGNAGAAIFAMTNAEGINWSNKVDVHNTNEEQVQTINIKVLPRKEVNVIEHIPELDKLTSPEHDDE